MPYNYITPRLVDPYYFRPKQTGGSWNFFSGSKDPNYRFWHYTVPGILILLALIFLYIKYTQNSESEEKQRKIQQIKDAIKRADRVKIAQMQHQQVVQQKAATQFGGFGTGDFSYSDSYSPYGDFGPTGVTPGASTRPAEGFGRETPGMYQSEPSPFGSGDFGSFAPF